MDQESLTKVPSFQNLPSGLTAGINIEIFLFNFDVPKNGLETAATPSLCLCS
jgi:hypothetical protein